MGRSASEDKYKSHGGWCWFLLLLLCNLLKVSYEWFTNQGNKVNEEKIERKKKTKKLYEFKGSVVKRRTTRGIILDDVHKSQADVHIVCSYNCIAIPRISISKRAETMRSLTQDLFDTFIRFLDPESVAFSTISNPTDGNENHSDKKLRSRDPTDALQC